MLPSQDNIVTPVNGLSTLYKTSGNAACLFYHPRFVRNFSNKTSSMDLHPSFPQPTHHFSPLNSSPPDHVNIINTCSQPNLPLMYQHPATLLTPLASQLKSYTLLPEKKISRKSSMNLKIQLRSPPHIKGLTLLSPPP